jgi:hypothetical protein
MDTPTTGLTALASVLADIARRLLSNVKLGVADIIGIILNDGSDIKLAVEHIKTLPREFINIDSDEGQELAALVKMKLGDQADKTNIDEILGQVFTAVPNVKMNVELVIESVSWEAKAIAVGELLVTAGRLFDLIHPPKALIMEEEDLAK